jgi:glycine reductase complex component B subunit gamma
MIPVAEMVGSNRIVPGNGIVHPMGDAERSPDEERRIRRRILERALEALERG